MINKFTSLITLHFIFVVSGCNAYEPEKMEEGTLIPSNTIIIVEQDSNIHLIPNQETTIRLSVSEIENRKVSDVFITANLKVHMGLERAVISTNSITFKANGNSSTIPINGFVTDRDGAVGINIGCGKDNINDCGILNIKSSDSWKVITNKDLDIGNQTLMVKRDT